LKELSIGLGKRLRILKEELSKSLSRVVTFLLSHSLNQILLFNDNVSYKWFSNEEKKFSESRIYRLKI